MSFQTLSRTDLTAVEEENLVRIVRDTERATVADSNGNTVTRYFPTASQSAALETLLAAYVNDIRRAARTARVIDREDAEMVATEKFLSLVYKDSGRDNERLAGFVSRAMVNAIMNADAEASAIRIPPDTLRRYFNLVAEEGSLEAAYAKCRDDANNFDPITLLAVSHALNAESIEAITSRQQEATEGTGAETSYGFTASDLKHSSTVGPEEQAVQADLIAWFFTLVPEEQAVILRLAYGFTDNISEALRLAASYQFDAPLSDAQIGPVVGRSRASVQRARVDALRVMNSAALAIAVYG